MAISKIIDNASNLEWGHKLSLAQVTSDGGVRRAQRQGPYRYTLTVTVPHMYDDSQAYYDIQTEIAGTLGYGVNTITTQLPALETTNRGVWDAALVTLGVQSGSTVSFTLLNANVAAVKAGDWFKFQGFSKVYQAVEDKNTNVIGQVQSLKINTPVVGDVGNSVNVIWGTDVEFKFALVSYDDPVKMPSSSTHSIVQPRTFVFEEVL